MKKIIILIIFIFNISYSDCITGNWFNESNAIIDVALPYGITDGKAYYMSNIGTIQNKIFFEQLAGFESSSYLNSTSYNSTIYYSSRHWVRCNVNRFTGFNSNCTRCERFRGRPAPLLENVFNPTIDDCYGYDPNYHSITGVKCWELGKENPLKPKNGGIPTIDGIWVKLVYTIQTSYNQYDSVAYNVVTGGCSGVHFNGSALDPRRAENYCTTMVVDMQPQYVCVCINDDGTIVNGTCESNGIDTGCGGINSFHYGSNNDSIILPCGDDSELRDSTPTVNPNDTNYIPDGFNKLLEGQRKQNELQEKTNGFLDGIFNILKSVFPSWSEHFQNMVSNLRSIKDGVDGTNNRLDSLRNHIDSIKGGDGSFDSSYFEGNDSILTNQEGTSIDTSGYGFTGFDSTGILSGIKEKYHIDSLSNDTNIIQFDTSDIESLFDMFRIDQDTTCDCRSDWFVLELFGEEVQFDICQYPLIAQVVRLILNTFVVFMLSWVGWNLIQRLLTETFT